MLKNPLETLILSKYYKNVTYSCVKNFYQKMQGFNNNNNSGSNDDRRFVKEIERSDDGQRYVQKDVLKNIRKWIPIGQTKEPAGFVFTIFNYNILSQALLECHSYLYQDSPRSSLKWRNRLYNIAGEIFKINPSILCCQVSKFACCLC